VRSTDRRSVGGAPPYARRPRPTYHGRISAVTPSSRPSHPYKCRTIFPSSRRQRRPTVPSAPPPSSCAPSVSHGRATAHVPSLDPIVPSRVACCPGRALAVAGAKPPRTPPPVLAVRPRRRFPRPNFGHPWVRWAYGRAWPLPRPEAPSVRRNWLEPCRPHGQGPHCKALGLSREFCAI
jgi:hypothetical protein